MFRWANHSGGFSVVEIIMVLAITSLLFLIAFSGQAEIRSRARFTDAIDQTVAAITKAQNEANSSLTLNQAADRGTGAGAIDKTIFFGMLARISNGESQITVTPMTMPEEPVLCFGGCSVEIRDDLQYSFEIPWQVSLDSPACVIPRWVAFTRHPSNGQNFTYTAPPTCTNVDLTRYNSYSASLRSPANVLNLQFRDDRNHLACISIDPPNGLVRKTFAAC